MNQADIELQIDELVLHGFESRDRILIAEAMNEELRRMFENQPLHPEWRQNFSRDRIDAGVFHTMPNSTPNAIGTAVARSVYAGLIK